MKLMGIREAAKEINVNEMRLRRACAAGKVPVIVLGSKRMVVLEQARRWRDRAEGLLNAAEMGAEIGLKESAVLRLYRSGTLPGIRVDNKVLFDADDVVRTLKNLATGGEEYDEDFADIEDGGEEAEEEPEEDFI